MNFLKQSIKTSRFTLLMMLVIAPMNQLGANPTSKNPHRGLAAHGTIPEAKALCESLYQSFNKGQSELISMFDRRDNPAGFSTSAIEQIAGDTYVTLRHAARLNLMGEPASADLTAKLQLLLSLIHISEPTRPY